MSENVIHSNDIAVTDFENDHIFVLHPKLRKETTQSCQTLETEIGGSSECIDTNHSPAHSDIELSIIENVPSPSSDNDDEHPVEISPSLKIRRDFSQHSQSFENGNSRQINSGKPAHSEVELSDMQNTGHSDADHNLCQLTVTSFLRQVQLLFTIKDKVAFNWTIIQTWYNMAFLQCSVPSYIKRNGESKKYEKASFHPQQILWAISATLLVLEMLSWIPKFLSELNQEPNPYVYIRMVSILASFFLRCTFLKLICCNGKLVTEFLNRNSKLLDIVPEERHQFIESRLIMIVTSITFVLHNVISVILGLLLRAYLQTGEWGWTGKVFLYAYSCYGRQLLWIGNNTCFGDGEVSDLYSVDIFYGILGLTTCANGLMSLSTAMLYILSCTATLFLAVISIQHVETVPALERYRILKEIADKLSKSVGAVLTAYMLFIAISLPDWIRLTFQSHNIVTITVAYNLLTLLTTKVIGCAATLQIDKMKSHLTGPEGVEELPTEMRLFTSIFQTIFHNSVGIGYPGLFVLTFRLLFSYFGIICSIIVVVHETVKEMRDDD